MKKNLTKKLMLSVLTLAFAVVSLGASTFAWFTIGGTQQEASFEASVKGGEGLDIAVTAAGVAPSEWFAAGSLPVDYIKNIIDTQNGGADWKFDAVTPAAALVPGANSFNKVSYVEAVADDPETTDVDESKPADFEYASASKGYVLFDIHFQLSDKTSATEYALYMESLTLESANVNAWKCDNTYQLASGEVLTGSSNYFNILSAIRLAVINKTTTEYNKVFEQKALDVTLDANNGYNTEGVSKEKGAASYYEVKTQRDFDDIAVVDAANAEIEWTGSNTLSLTEQKVQAVLKGDAVVTLTIACWVEGWDMECLNALFAQQLAASFEFSLRKPDGSTL